MSVRLDVRHYESIVAVVESGSMKDAAGWLMTTQSALSHRIAEAERRLGGELFDRRAGRAVRPTDAARSLYQTAVAALAELERGERDFVATAGTTRRVVRLGVAVYDAYEWFPPLRHAVDEAGLDVTIDLASVGDAPVERLAAGAVDVVLAPGLEPQRAVPRTAHDDELVLIVHADHPLAARSSIAADDLGDEVFLTHSETPWPGFEYDRFLRPAGVRPRLLTVVDRTSSIVEMVAAGLGVAILSRWALRPAIDHHRLVAVRCGGGLPLRWSVMIRPTDVDGPADRVAELLAGVLCGDR